MPLVAGGHPVKNRDWLLRSQPTGTYRESLERVFATGNVSALTSAVLTTVAVPLQDGDVVKNLTFVSGTTAAGTPTHWFFALYDTNGALLAQTADQTSTAWAANTAKTLALATSQLITVPGTYYAGICVVASTPPTLAGVTLQNTVLSTGVFGTEKVLAQTSGSALVATAPATIATPTTVSTVPYVAVN